jgi:hypothetical protein
MKLEGLVCTPTEDLLKKTVTVTVTGTVTEAGAQETKKRQRNLGKQLKVQQIMGP